MSALPEPGPRARLLFVDDEPNILAGLSTMLRRHRSRWEMRFVLGGAAALEAVRREPFDLVVCDMRMPNVDGATVLAEVRRVQPSATRIVLSGFATQENALRAAPIAHQLLSKPSDPERLVATIERALALHRLVHDPKLRASLGGVDQLPSTPATWQRLLELLALPNVGAREVAEVISVEPGMTARLLQLASSLFSLPREVVSVTEGVALLGTETLRSLVLLAGAFSFAERAQPTLVERLRLHALAVGALAREIVVEPADRNRAFVAGLLHDVGRLVLAVRDPDGLERTTAAALAADVTLHEAEAQLLGVTHAEIGAVLLSRWGLPLDVVEAAAFHHGPLPAQASPSLVAVHVADRLVADEAARRREPLDRAGLDRLGLAARVPGWLERARAGRSPS